MPFRDRYLRTLTFQETDRVPFMPGWPRESTLEAWWTQGLDPDADWWATLLRAVNLPEMPAGPGGVDVSFQMIPVFEEKVLEHREGHYVVQDWMGAVTEISDVFDVTYIRTPKDFVTRKWHRFPVQNRADWASMRERFDPNSAGRFGERFGERARDLQQNGIPTTVQVNGPFWQLREWLGFENLCTLFLDDPEFIREMVEFWTEFVSEALGRMLLEAPLDRLGISEDMAYKAHAMISPEMTRTFLAPTYRRWVDQVKSAGCQLVDVDSDGCIGELIPVWIECGVNVCDPMEVAAHNDLPALRTRFGKKMAFMGGVDKRAIAAGGRTMLEELDRLAPVVADGGYIPSCDHGVPPDISWPDFVAYARRLAEVTGWL